MIRRHNQLPHRPSPFRALTGSNGNSHSRHTFLNPHRAAAVLGLALDELLLISRAHNIGRPALRDTDHSGSGPFFTHEDLVRLARVHDSRRLS